ncbi:hypothetical protein SEVIR_7G089300v4 [Setaria viridis]|uniref:HMA domain-containing protein n=1 Tax=Setaria viridis TaxID=4556 RepID=A0A4U6TQC6_SETVI|nr:protein PYRICULARIA ORYZAE RESISTANCE 21-like [Setaria viridis]TKW04132.1 hypothetical protein SEVIR_7G089300v2 [Setaria viridis]
MGILVITVDLECCRCRAKISKVLNCLKEEFCIEKIEFEDKNKKVVVRGKFDAEKLCKKVWCKAGKFVKEIVIAEVWPMPPPPKPCKPCKEEPKSDPGKAAKPVKCDCDHCCKVKAEKCEPESCKPKTKPEKTKPPTAPKTEYKLVPYPYPYPLSYYPAMCPSWPRQCPPQQQCQGCQKPPPPPPPCSCSNHGSCGCHGTPPAWPTQPPVWPPPWGSSCNIVTEDNSCSVM